MKMFFFPHLVYIIYVRGLSEHGDELAFHYITSMPDAIKIDLLVQRLLGCMGRSQKQCTQVFAL